MPEYLISELSNSHGPDFKTLVLNAKAVSPKEYFLKFKCDPHPFTDLLCEQGFIKKFNLNPEPYNYAIFVKDVLPKSYEYYDFYTVFYQPLVLNIVLEFICYIIDYDNIRSWNDMLIHSIKYQWDWNYLENFNEIDK